MRFGRLITGNALGGERRGQDANGVSDTLRSNYRLYGKIAGIPPESNLSDSFYALLGLHAAAEAGVPVGAEAWTLAGRYWRESQRADGGWGYIPNSLSTASMTGEGVASL